MPVRNVPDHPDLSYFLLSFTSDGLERSEVIDGSEGLFSKELALELAENPITDVFLISHGWKGDGPAAIDQYDRWISAMASCTADQAKVRQSRLGFHPLLIGLHWPSLPWGDEEINSSPASYSLEESLPLEQFVNAYAKRIADTPAARNALTTLFEAAMDNICPESLTPDVRKAYLVLNRESGLCNNSEGAAPGDDREPFDPDLAYMNSVTEAANFGSISLGGILAPLRQLSFWKMKDRARRFGEGGGHQLLRGLQTVARSNGRDVRFHLMGHSFGCIVMSAILRGPDAGDLSVSPVHSLFLVQGALSLWSYCDSIPSVPDRSGYFHSLISGSKVAGPIVATLSEHDTAVGRYYPLGAGILRQISYAMNDFPKYGGVGSFGIQGPGITIDNWEMIGTDDTYGFRPGRAYNLDASAFICKMDGASGAHNDIAHLAVAHAFWEAVMCSGIEPAESGGRK
jgi:hypothetical protein